ncbi:MAG: multicopper oxidase domain-containing protein [Bacteroidetes bacterium]|nr:multicopper oxidase domain-containing protein [Bacteroidota bacterium]
MNNPVRTLSAAAVLLLLLATRTFAQPTFINRIPLPPLVDAANGIIHLEMRITTHRFNPGNPSDSLNGGINQPNGITTYAYNLAGDSTMTMLGPTLKLHTLDSTHITVKNLIGVPTTTHWHGTEVPASMDGGPHEGIEPDSTWYVDFRTLDSASTMWYHPHYHNLTVQHVQKGLSGMIFAEQAGDPIRNTLPHTYGADDIPVIIGDLGFTTGSSRDSGMVIDTNKAKRPYNLVNGVVNPYVEVPAHVVRLRILNGSTRKGILFGVSNSYANPFPNLSPFYLIASDGGYMLKPDTLTSLLNGPGARDEIVLDLSGYHPGDTLYLSNLKDSLPNYVIGSPQTAPNNGGQDTTMGTAFLQLRIVPDSAFPGYTPVTSFAPFTTVWTPGLSDTFNIARHRLKELMGGGPGHGFTIDGQPYSMEVINDTVYVGTKEIWAIHNMSNTAHPFHIHKIQFRVLDVKDSLGNDVNLETYGMNGPKDDVLILPGWTLRFLGQYDDYPSPIDPMNCYMYHCHILTHEDSLGGGMMHQFVVADTVTSSVAEARGGAQQMELVPRPAEGIAYLMGHSTRTSTVTIFDIEGRRIRTQQLPVFNGSAVIDIGGLAAGPYLVEWRTRNDVTIGKMVVVR